MDRLYKLRMSGMAEAFEKQLLEPNTGLEPVSYTHLSIPLSFSPIRIAS